MAWSPGTPLYFVAQIDDPTDITLRTDIIKFFGERGGTSLQTFTSDVLYGNEAKQAMQLEARSHMSLFNNPSASRFSSNGIFNIAPPSTSSRGIFSDANQNSQLQIEFLEEIDNGRAGELEKSATSMPTLAREVTRGGRVRGRGSHGGRRGRATQRGSQPKPKPAPSLKQHVTPVGCAKCDYVFPSKPVSKLRHHAATHFPHTSPFYACSVCPLTFFGAVNRKAVEEHVKGLHAGAAQVVDLYPKTGNSIKNRPAFDKARAELLAITNKCFPALVDLDEGNKKTPRKPRTSQLDLIVKQQEKTRMEGEASAERSRQRQQRKSLRDMHKRDVHCKMCLRVVAGREAESHATSHLDQTARYKCPACAHTANDENNIRAHMQLSCAAAQITGCDMVDTWKDNQQMSAAIRSKMKECFEEEEEVVMLNETVGEEQEQESEERLEEMAVCRECGLMLADPRVHAARYRTLEAHALTHMPERVERWKCAQCHYTAATMGVVGRHGRKHGKGVKVAMVDQWTDEMVEAHRAKTIACFKVYAEREHVEEEKEKKQEPLFDLYNLDTTTVNIKMEP